MNKSRLSVVVSGVFLCLLFSGAMGCDGTPEAVPLEFTLSVDVEEGSPPVYRWQPDIGITSLVLDGHTCIDAEGEQVVNLSDCRDFDAVEAAGGTCTQWDESVWEVWAPGDSYGNLIGETFTGPVTHGVVPEDAGADAGSMMHMGAGLVYRLTVTRLTHPGELVERTGSLCFSGVSTGPFDNWEAPPTTPP